MWEILQETVYKTHITNLELSTTPLTMAAAMTTWSNFAHSVHSCCFISFRSVMRTLYTFSCNTPTRCTQLDSNLANLMATVGTVRWAFQVSQGNVETLFRIGGKHYITLQQIHSGNSVPNFIRIARVFSERELTSSSVCMSVVCLSVCNVRAPYSGDWNFRQCSYGIGYVGQLLTSR